MGSVVFLLKTVLGPRVMIDEKINKSEYHHAITKAPIVMGRLARDKCGEGVVVIC